MSVENSADLNNWIVVIGVSIGRIQVLNDLSQVITHPLQLSVKVFCQAVDAFTLRIRWRCVGKRSFQWTQYFIQFRLLAFNEVQLMFQPLVRQVKREEKLICKKQRDVQKCHITC